MHKTGKAILDKSSIKNRIFGDKPMIHLWILKHPLNLIRWQTKQRTL